MPDDDFGVAAGQTRSLYLPCATEDAGVLEASEVMRGHHPESCPHHVLQQGELVVDMSCASGQCVRRVVQGLRAVKMGGAPLVLIFEMPKKNCRPHHF